jgi:hypothetical protein
VKSQIYAACWSISLLHLLGHSIPCLSILPFKRNESIDLCPAKPSKVVKQAAADIANGLQDTGSIEQMDSTYKKLKGKK